MVFKLFIRIPSIFFVVKIVTFITFSRHINRNEIATKTNIRDMKKILSMLLLALCIGALTANADSKVITVNKSYSGISVSTGVTVKYTPSSTSKGTTSIEINGPADRINWIEAAVVDNTLCIYVKSDKINNRSDINIGNVKVSLSGPLVNKLTVSSAGKIFTNTWLEFKNSTFRLSASSAGSIKLANVTAPEIKANASSASDIDINTVNSPKVSLTSSSSADIDIKKINGETIIAGASSAADIDVSSAIANSISLKASSSADIDFDNVSTSSISATASSSGDISISGSAVTAKLYASSGGDLKVKNLKCSNKSIKESSGGSIKE